MKKTLLSLLMISVIIVTLMGSNASASVYEVLDYSTGVKYVAPEDTVTLTFEMSACLWAALYGEIIISYRHTSPKSAAPGGFETDLNDDGLLKSVDGEVIVGREWVDGIWYGTATFDSYINPSASRGTNHGDIMVYWPTGYDWTFEWSFNVRHS